MSTGMPRVDAIWQRLARVASRQWRAFKPPELYIDERAGQPCTLECCRQRAFYNEGHDLVGVASRLEDDPDPRIEGVLRHELGHALLCHLGYSHHSERDADRMAQTTFGAEIRYDADLIQTIGEGAAPRPVNLG